MRNRRTLLYRGRRRLTAAMSAATLVVGSALGLLVAGLYAAIGMVQLRRARPAGRLGLRLFALFWLAFSAHALVESVWALSMILARPPLWVGILVLLAKIASGVVAFGCLVAYMLLVYSGRERALVWVGAAYSAILAVVTYAYLSRVPIAQETRTWYAGLRYVEHEGALHLVVVALLFVPPLVATCAYAMLLRVSRDPAQRRRILATSVGFAALFGGLLLGWLNESWYWWGLVERLLPLGASAAILLASRAEERAHAPAANAA